jgi:hypothetical protein
MQEIVVMVQPGEPAETAVAIPVSVRVWLVRGERHELVTVQQQQHPRISPAPPSPHRDQELERCY